MNGVLVVNKDSNMTSRDVINKLNHIFATKKIGHTGTLDPMAKGVLVICIGKYTKLVSKITDLDKEYIATAKLGIKTDTLDTTGNVLETKNFVVDEEKIKEILNSFKGRSIQETPLYSAVKIKGKKLYEYAREGLSVTLPKRDIEVFDISLEKILSDGFTFKVRVSKGTYIRSLINDICEKLGTIGVMSDLIRTRQGRFSIENSFTLEDIESNNYNLLNIEDVFNYKVINMTNEEYFKVKNGAKLEKNINDGNYFMFYENHNIAIYNFIEKIGKIDVML